MPIYEYECPVCGRFEVIQKFSDKVLKACPNCKEKGKSSPVKKAVSASAFHLKGSGWYKTDYSSGSSSSSPKTKSSSESSKSETDTSSSTKSAKSCGTGCGCH
jgi:putative FmdB family regulatory protein